MDDFVPSPCPAACYFSSRSCYATVETSQFLQEKYNEEVKTRRIKMVTFWELLLEVGLQIKFHMGSSSCKLSERVRACDFCDLVFVRVWLIRQSQLSTSGNISLAPVAVGPANLCTLERHFFAKFFVFFWVQIGFTV